MKEKEAGPMLVGETCIGSCGSLSWTRRTFGRITHKHGCALREDPFCQSHPNGCPSATILDPEATGTEEGK